MPIIHILVGDGPTNEIKKHLIQKVTAAAVESGCGPSEKIRVLIHEKSSSVLLIAPFPLASDRKSNLYSLPIVQVFLIEGRSPAVTATLAVKIAAAVTDVCCTPPQGVHVSIGQLPSAAWGIGGTPASEKGR